ncbi:TfoX/Sxy family protein [Nocardia neocaledoniensis]|jgi:TfoX/Sxy family transcriptional regulator of competence genes|uniref:TfoX/Sxy family protein n=1 Tax=Nocardia neocaledoniensis TaxID=236511 RepID=UPI002453AA13|nr:TfoX/Sxy family protein [Nocardia neocaledoniensis]
MAYDEELADRVREIAHPGRTLTEQRMFGGLGFLTGGNMAVAVSGQGGLLVRVDPGEFESLQDGDAVAPMVMGGRVSRGWLRVTAATVEDDTALREWVERGLDYAEKLPPKRKRSVSK